MERPVQMKSQDHLLQGTLHLPEGPGPFPFVLLFHGFCDDRNEINFVHTELSRKLAEQGIGSVRFDFAGSGESEGCFADMTISAEVQDAENILAWAKEQDFVDTDRIGLHGTSLGGCVAGMTAGRRPEVRALSMWCPAPDVATNLHHKVLCGIDVSDVEEKGYMDVEGLVLSRAFYDDALTLDPYGTAARYPGPVNIVHGDADTTASVHCSHTYKELFGDRADLLVVHGADHRFTSIPFRKARMDSALQFLVRELKEKGSL